jgi:propionyl-CoA carboxylase beta chain
MRDRGARLAEERARALGAGGEKRVEAQHLHGKLTARERVELLLDPDSFEEFDMLVQHRLASETQVPKLPGDGVVTGCGTVHDRPVFVFARDVTVFGGSLGEAHARKITKVQDLALRSRAPIVGLFDARGARAEEGIAALRGYGEIFQRNVLASGVIPQISLIMGACAGGDAHSPALTDFIFMVRDTSHMFLSGPDVVQRVTHENVTADELGGALVHTTRSSIADGAYDNDVDALLQIRRLLDFLPQSNVGEVPERPSFDDCDRLDMSLDTLVPDDANEPYAIDELIRKVADEGDFFEIQGDFAQNIVTGFGRIAGRTVGFVANQPKVLAGALDSDAARKAARFVRFCDCFGIPIVNFVDIPGFLPGTAQEHGGIIKHTAKLLYAFAEATVPIVTVVTRKAFGSAYDVMASPHPCGDVNLAWPTAQIALMGDDRAAQSDVAEDGPHRTGDGEGGVPSPFPAARRGYVDGVIMPHATRRSVARAFAMLRHKTLERPWKKHGNIPL